VLNVSDRLTLSGSNSGLFANTAPGSSGNGGSIFIDPRTVTIQDGAKIAVDSQGSGIGGNIFLQAGRLELRDRGSITAGTASSQGGNITLDVKGILLMRQKSLISATAGTAGADGDGGNIKIDIPKGFIVGVPLENSDIIANASKGKGGRVDINPKGIFGLQKREAVTDFSDITASSESGPTGTVNITPPDVDPNRGLVPLPVALTDPSNKIDQQCAAGTTVGSSQFVIRGQGSLPASPQDNANSTSTIVRLATIPANAPGRIDTPQKADRSIPTSIVEAQTAIRQANGVIRFAVAPQLDASRPALPTPNCRRRFLGKPA
jgi:large exoprotein involved in heme utilization and adhesion